MISSYTVEGVSGQHDARGILTLTDVSGEHRDDVTVSFQEDFDPDNPEPVRIEAADLDPLSGTLVGDNIEGVTVPQWSALASTGEQPHVGPWRVYARIEVGATVAEPLDMLVRFSYRAGDGPLSQTDRPAVTPHLAAQLIEVDLGLANIREVEGDHSWSGQVEFKGETAGRDVKLRELLFMPATRFARVRAPQKLDTVEGFVGYDTFAQAAGPLDGVTAPLGGLWDRVAGDTDDFTINDTLGVVQRSTVNDSAIGSGPIGILARLGTGVATHTIAQVDVHLSTDFASGAVAGGLLIRYVDANNWLVAVRGHDVGVTATAYLMKCVAGTPEVISYAAVPAHHPPRWRTVGVAADEDGNVALFEGPRGGPLAWVGGVGADADLATGGVLAEGGYGLHDASSVASGAPLRMYDNFTVTAAAESTADHAIHAGQSLRLDWRKAERESADGTQWGIVPHFEGARLKVPPSTRNSYVHRLVIKQDRNDLTQLPVGTEPPPELCENPDAAVDTAGWTPASLVTFERTTTPPAGAPAATAFHCVGNADGDHARDGVAVTAGRTYRFSARVYLDSSTATGIGLEVRNAAGGSPFGIPQFSTLDSWGELALEVTADATETWTFRIRQIGAGDIDWYFTAVSIRQVLLTPTLSVRPRVLLASG